MKRKGKVLPKKKSLFDFPYLFDWFREVTHGKLDGYAFLWRAGLFTLINFSIWLITTLLNAASQNEINLNDGYLLAFVLLFTYETILKQKR